MKTITIRLPDVEAAMLVELGKRSRDFRDVNKLFVDLIRKRFEAIYGRRSSWRRWDYS
jgi:hypothetical protein